MLVAQVRHGKLADVVEVIRITIGGKCAVVGFDGFFRQKIGGNVGNIVAVVGGFGPFGIAGLEALGAQLHTVGQRGDLHAGIVVIKLACDVPALRGQQVANGITQGGLPPVPDVQRAGGVGRHKFHHQFLSRGRLHAVLLLRRQHFADDLLFGFGLEANVQKAGACNFNGMYPLLVSGLCLQCGLELFAQCARVLLERLGQLHGGIGGPIAVLGLFGGFECGFFACTGTEFFQLGGQGGEQILFDLLHGALL